MRGAAGWLRARLVRMHHDDRGVVSVLVILTVWCMVALLGMLFNEVEQSRRKSQMQAAADAGAYSSTVWMARTSHIMIADNMALAQDVSTESIWAASKAADDAIQARLAAELKLLDQMAKNPSKYTQPDQAQLLKLIGTIGTDYAQTAGALANLQAGTGANFDSPEESQDYLNKYRQAQSAMDWVMTTYIGGAAPKATPGAPARPGPPGPKGEGLAQIVASWKPAQTVPAIVAYVQGFINGTELKKVGEFEAQTKLARDQAVDVQIAAHESALYQNSVTALAETAGHVEDVRQQLQTLFGADITNATLQNAAGATGSAVVNAPFMPASAVPSVTGHVDMIRQKYADQLPADMNGSIVTIDGINPHTRAARVWHPDMPATVDAASQIQYGLASTYPVTGNFPDGWGHEYAWPIERYARQRSGADMQEIEVTYMEPLDRMRTNDLAEKIRDMLGMPPGAQLQDIADLPGTIPDDRPKPVPPPPPGVPPLRPVYENINVLPRLAAPARADAGFRTQVDLYNESGAQFTADVRRLRLMASNDLGNTPYAIFTDAFASNLAPIPLWGGSVTAAMTSVLDKVGQKKEFMVLASSGLRAIPAWAQGDQFSSSVAMLESQIIKLSVQSVSDAILAKMEATDPSGLGGGILDKQYQDIVLRLAYAGAASQIAEAIVRPTAHQIAMEIAAEWINRPWPYEITPPADNFYPAPRGINPRERKQLYSVLTAARQTDASVPRTVLPALFLADTTKLTAYAQGEMFNWMEFNASYGGSEHFDETTTLNNVTYYLAGGGYHEIIPVPEAWRASTTGGWQYRARLSLADMLTFDPRDSDMDLFGRNVELQQYFNDAGGTTLNGGVARDVNLH